MTDITIAAPLAAALSAKGYENLTSVQTAMLGEDVVVMAVMDVDRTLGIDLPAGVVDRVFPGLLPGALGRMLAHAVYAEDP